MREMEKENIALTKDVRNERQKIPFTTETVDTTSTPKKGDLIIQDTFDDYPPVPTDDIPSMDEPKRLTRKLSTVSKILLKD